MNMRYKVRIKFKTKMGNVPDEINQKVARLKEAVSYKDILDDTVEQAYITDGATGRVLWLKE